jgi:hypothetical protein
MASPDQRKSALAFGGALIALTFLLETWNANRITPHPASPVIWAVLGIIAVVALGLGVLFRVRGRHLQGGAGSANDEA